ncbi:MAG: spore coat protein [Eubacterium sp.]|nr:spore coat protein [Eubacterium sp.]
MQDKNLMQDMLMLEKGVCDLYMHGAIESSTANVNQAFKTALSDSLTMQNSIYSQMEANGWYQTEPVQQSEINTLKQKYNQPSAS